MKIGIGRAIAIGAVLSVVLYAGCSYHTVDPGYRAYTTRFGKVTSESLKPDLYFVDWFTGKMHVVNVQPQKWESKGSAYTKDNQTATLSFTLTFNPDPDQVHVLIPQYGNDWASNLIGQEVFQEMEREMGQHDAGDVIQRRDEVARHMESNIQKILLKRHIQAQFALTNIDFSDVFEKAVEAKVVAQQTAEQERNNTVRIKELATQKIEQARGEAESTKLAAEAEAIAIKKKADALAAAPKLIEYETATRWNGQLPTYMGGSMPMPFVNIGK